MTDNKPKTIQNRLSSLPAEGINGLKKLFWEELNYDRANTPISTTDWDPTLTVNLAERPVLFASAANEAMFHIIYSHLTGEKMPIGRERALIQKLILQHPHSLFVFSNQSQTHWHFVNAMDEKSEIAQRRRVLRRISVSPEDRLRTASERLARLDVNLANADLLGLDPVRLQNQHESAFDVEEVTQEFFQDYQAIFNLLKAALTTQNHNPQWAHDFALLFLNRLMFLYYIERKRWLGNDTDFLHNFWRAYKHANQPKDTFVSQWLEVLVFEAFNKKFSAGRSDVAFMPQAIRDALQLAPWLNGGLFTKTSLDTDYSYSIGDALISQIFAFLDRYNFTISEDTPLDQEVAVDPEMIGKVYESLVNVSSEADDRSDAGIFYTPRIEIDLMCRLSLADWLMNHLTDIRKSDLYELVFAFSPEDNTAADLTITEHNLWPKLDQVLSGITVLDPACGSGSFLVGMLMILDDLQARCAAALGKVETPYERRKRIVGSSLYGVDIMEWAVHVAELRLWLQLVIETDIDPNELLLRPLLPNLSFKIRRGDSLVQEWVV
ncbi:MAG: DNA methyltransferase [Bellilinea sp.]